MRFHSILIEYRGATKGESKEALYGCTTTIGDVTKIYIRQNQNKKEMVNTFFHEVAHAFNHFHGFNGDKKEDERISRLVGDIVEPCYRKYMGKLKRGGH